MDLNKRTWISMTVGGVATLLILGGAARSFAQDPDAAPSAAPSPVVDTTPEQPPADPEALPGGPVSSQSESRLRIERGLGEIGDMATEARKDEDIVRLECVSDKQAKAGKVEEIAQGELRVLRDPNSQDMARTTAVEKLDAAADDMDAIVKDAKACSGEQGPEDESDETRNEADAPIGIPLQNPTLGMGQVPLPPPVDIDWLVVASPIE